MPGPGSYSKDQLDTLRAAAREGGRAECPVCSVAMDRQEVPPRPDVSYVRDRILLVCPTCHRTHVVDRAEKR